MLTLVGLFARLVANPRAVRIAMPFARYPIRKADRGAIPGAIRKVLRMSVPDLQGMSLKDIRIG